MSDYTAHRKISALMFEADYPLIEKERHIVRKIVNGLENHPQFKEVARMIIVTGIPEQIHALEEYGTIKKTQM